MIQGGGEDGVTWSIRDGIYKLFVIMTHNVGSPLAAGVYESR